MTLNAGLVYNKSINFNVTKCRMYHINIIQYTSTIAFVFIF